MHVIIGLLGLGLVINYVLSGEHSAFTGVVHIPSIVLLASGPVCVVISTYKPRELLRSFRELWESLRFDAVRSRAELYDSLTRFATEVRARRQGAALEISDASSNTLLKQLAPLVVRQYTADEIERTASTALFVRVSAMKRAEDVFGTLARVAPATGLIGTVIGLISLLKDLSRFEQLGPSMALALLCTLYGLLLANAVYQPLGRHIRSHAAVVAEEAKLVTRGLVLAAEGKPLADVRRLFDTGGAPGAPSAPPNLAMGGEG